MPLGGDRAWSHATGGSQSPRVERQFPAGEIDRVSLKEASERTFSIKSTTQNIIAERLS